MTVTGIWEKLNSLETGILLVAIVFFLAYIAVKLTVSDSSKKKAA